MGDQGLTGIISDENAGEGSALDMAGLLFSPALIARGIRGWRYVSTDTRYGCRACFLRRCSPSKRYGLC